METLYSKFRKIAAEHTEHPAIMGDGSCLSYGGLLTAVQQLGAELGKLGVRRGSPVGLMRSNDATFVSAFFAVAEVGGIVVPINPSFKGAEIASILADSEADLVLTSENLARNVRSAESSVKILVPEDPRTVRSAGGYEQDEPASSASPNDPVLYMYSSGSTGRPKRIIRNHYQLLYETERLIASLALSSADRVIGVAPFSHINGLMRSMVASMLSGAMLFPISQFERGAVAETIQDHRITVFIGVPFMFTVLSETRWPRPVDFSSLRWCISSSAPLRGDISRKFHERYGNFVYQLYGSTETGTIAVNLSPNPEAFLDSVGHPLDGVSVEIFSEDRQLLTGSADGEIGIRSPAAIQGYPGLPEQTQQSFWNGYFFPGDVGHKDAEGRIYLEGRKSLFINRGGYKVNPYEIEELLEQHPKIKEAAVIGVETEHRDQKIKAVIVSDEPLEELEIMEFCRARVADFKVPSIVEVRTSLPRSPTGKLLRKAL